MTDQRPDPDKLLEKVQRDEAKARAGRLKIFFGACAGVGKTYAMLSEAREVQAQGVDVVVGVVETHKRVETEALLEGLEVLPPRRCPIAAPRCASWTSMPRSRASPQLLLVDELAHSNAPGSRHPKRWQDVKELLAAGIDVYTTVNVQHVESLNDVVGQITGVRVWETVPDKVFDEADEIELVDLPADDLLQRLKEGKVYMPEQAAHAVANFFRKGNLIALRELALRRTADRVDAQAREYREDEAITGVWQLKERLLVAVGSGRACRAGGARRTAPRRQPARGMDRGLRRDARACSGCPKRERARILRALRLAQELGAETATRARPGRRRRAARLRRRAQRRQDRAGPLERQPLAARRSGRRCSTRCGTARSGVDLLVVGGEAAEQPAPAAATSPRGAAEGSLARLHRSAGGGRRGHRDRPAAAPSHRDRQHRDALPAERGGGLGARRARSLGRSIGPGVAAVRFLLRPAVFHLRRLGHRVSAHLRGHAGGRAHDHPSHRGHALSGPRSCAPRAARRLAVRR